MDSKKQINVYSPATINAIKYFLCNNHFFPLNNIAETSVYFPQKFVQISPFVLSMLAAWAQECNVKKIPLMCFVDDIRVLNYAWRMHLTEFMNIKYDPAKYKEHESSGRFVPLTEIRSSNQLNNFLVAMMPLLHLKEDSANAVRYCFSELIRNVLEHAGENISAFVCAQYYKKSNKISIGIADCGQGILSSLKRVHEKYHDDKTAIIDAMKPGITGGSKKENAGAGLYFIKSIAKGAGTYFAIYSGSACYRLRQKRKEEKAEFFADPLKERYDLYENLPYWQGTVIAVEIGLDHVMAFEEILSEIRETFYVSKVKKEKRSVKFT